MLELLNYFETYELLEVLYYHIMIYRIGRYSEYWLSNRIMKWDGEKRNWEITNDYIKYA